MFDFFKKYFDFGSQSKIETEEDTKYYGRMQPCKNGHYYDNTRNVDCPYCLETLIAWSSEETELYTHVDYQNIRGDIELKKNDIFDKYIIEQKISSGGFSTVYKVVHGQLNHTYALKIFNYTDIKPKDKEHTEVLMTEILDETIIQDTKKTKIELKKLFLKEAENLANLSHSNIVKVFDVGVFEGDAYIVLEFIEKTRLDIILQNIQQFTVEKTYNLLEDISNALIEQEKKKIIHSDIRPQNIFLRENNTFCLIDYGNMNSENITAHAKGFVSPEHYKKNELSHQSDLFLLGLTAWQCLVGKTPKSEEWNFKVPSIKDYRNDIPKELLKIIDNLLQIEPSKRYKTAKDLLSDIHLYRYHGEEPIGAIQGTIFVAISYNDTFSSTYDILNKTAKNRNLKCIRMDRLHFQDEIWKNIALEIEHSNIIIADFSEANIGCGANANVITEASHARAKGKDIIIITQSNPEDLPFDWRYLPTIKYSSSKEGLTVLSKKIDDKLRVFNF